MKNHRLFATSMATAVLLASPVLAQRAGLGGGLVGGVGGNVQGIAGGGAGSVAGSASAAARGTASATAPSATRGGAPAPSAPTAPAVNIAENAALASRVGTMLPAGQPLAGAAAGFRNQGQFVSAVHASHNLGIPFDSLKATMTGDSAVSLGKAITTLRPEMAYKDVKDNVKLAEKQSARDFTQASAAGGRDSVAARLASDSNLSARLTGMLPSGATLTGAAAGFKNSGQFIATLVASNNTGLSFADLKDRVTAGQSLGAAIHAMKPAMSESEAGSSAADAESQSKAIQSGGSVQTKASASGSASVK